MAHDLDELSQEKDAEEKASATWRSWRPEAAALARQMAQGRLTPEMTERQEQLFHRLLDAGRSLEKDDEEISDERESKTAGAFERGDVVPLDGGASARCATRCPTPSSSSVCPRPCASS